MTLGLHLFISGQVQGVSCRASAASMASRLGLAGWVRNLPEGRVELLAQGEEKTLRSLLAWAHEGLLLARVDHVEAHRDEAREIMSGFRTRG